MVRMGIGDQEERRGERGWKRREDREEPCPSIVRVLSVKLR